MNVCFDAVLQLLEEDLKSCNENSKSFSTIITLPVIREQCDLNLHHSALDCNYKCNSDSILFDVFNVFDVLHIQTIYRTINIDSDGETLQQHEYLFLALRNVEIKPEYQKQGICTKLIQCLLEFCIKHKINFWIDDVVNDNLYHFLSKTVFKPCLALDSAHESIRNKPSNVKLTYMNYIKAHHYYENDVLNTEDMVLRCFYYLND